MALYSVCTYEGVCESTETFHKLCLCESLQHFVSNCGDYAVHMVDNLLDILTDCEHSKTNAILLQVGLTPCCFWAFVFIS